MSCLLTLGRGNEAAGTRQHDINKEENIKTVIITISTKYLKVKP